MKKRGTPPRQGVGEGTAGSPGTQGYGKDAREGKGKVRDLSLCLVLYIPAQKLAGTWRQTRQEPNGSRDRRAKMRGNDKQPRWGGGGGSKSPDCVRMEIRSEKAKGLQGVLVL